MIRTQLVFIDAQNPYRTLDSTIVRWLRAEHATLASFPILENANESRIRISTRNHNRLLKMNRLTLYHPANHPIPTTHRHSTSLIDTILTSRYPDLIKHLILYRGNQFGRGNGRCSICSLPFEQYHMSACAQLASIPIMNISEMIGKREWSGLRGLFRRWWEVCNRENEE